ncbi:MAG: response regulator transcription factor [Bacteroidetes bacterium]|jgi:DNA-binding response OmpR family regulator|nr:response regulator transcription factor [Bacteroidota bacterium]MBX7238306.1 response regulator transcription factor [Bacteroidia bacterium]MCW5919719.1 response regulator transcription factor [Bacteroidota bacterium]HMU77770.1 response regulator transcription factor [Bacteroidia bacterium]HMW08862.1 response regulator transcription factor [Bacteroidia bacterium]
MSILTGKTKIMIAEDDTNFGLVLKDYLSLHEYDVHLYRDGRQAFEKFEKGKFNLCILDVMMPIMDGFALAENIKAKDSNVPIIFLTAKSMKVDMIRGFKIGADDYITKPFDSEILLFKIKALLNRSETIVKAVNEQVEFVIGGFKFNSRLRTIQGFGKEEKLSPKEAALLALLCVYLNDILPREVALRKIWNDDNYFTARSMDVFITKIRKYLKDDPNIELLNVHGNGYRLVVKD